MTLADAVAPAAVFSEAQRARAMAAFLAAHGWGGVLPQRLAGDASFRNYYRLANGNRSVVLMDAPPPQEDVRRYVKVAAILRGFACSAPEIFAEDGERGFLLIEDFGDDTYTRLLASGANETALYTLAIDTLTALQRTVSIVGIPDLPPYDETRLLTEAALLVDWYAPAAIGAPLPGTAREEYLELWKGILPQTALPGPTFVLRDYHIDNLMLLPHRSGIRSCGLLDFQDAVCGPAAYDLVSLLKDARRDVPPGLRDSMTARYLTSFPEMDRAAFSRSAAILAVQRNCKILGLFVRLSERDGKPDYLVHIPRVWRLIEDDLHEPVLAPIARWLNRYLPAALRRRPKAPGAA